MNTFKNAEMGDPVYSVEFGHGEITKIRPSRCLLPCWCDEYPIKVHFESGRSDEYTYDGKRLNDKSVNQTLFWTEVRFDVPRNPHVLREYRKLEKRCL